MTTGKKRSVSVGSWRRPCGVQPVWLEVVGELSRIDGGSGPASSSGWRVVGEQLEACLIVKGREEGGGLRRRQG